MALVPAKCTECGAAIEVDAKKEAGICEHCGTAFITEKAINNFNNIHNVTNNVTKIINGNEKDEGEDFFNRGLTNLRLKKYESARKNFDKAICLNPEVANYYFYWTYAASEGLKDLRVFFNELAPSFWRTEEEKEDGSIESFFELATAEEKQTLSNEYGINLNDGLKNLQIELLNMAFENETFLQNFNLNYYMYDYKNILEDLSVEERDAIKENANKFLHNYAKKLFNEKQKVNLVRDMLVLHINFNMYPNANLLSKYVSKFDILDDILISEDADRVIKEYEEGIRTQKEKEEKEIKFCAKENKAKSVGGTVAGICAFIGLILGVVLTWSKYASNGSGIISLLIGAGVAAVVGGLAYGITYGIVMTSESKDKNKK